MSRGDSFLQLVNSADPRTTALQLALRGDLVTGEAIRAPVWKMCLGLIDFPPAYKKPAGDDSDAEDELEDALLNRWKTQLAAQRDKYEQAVAKQASPEAAAAKAASPKAPPAAAAATKPAAKKSSGPRFADDDSSSSNDDDEEQSAVDAAKDNPLASAPDTQWGKYFERQKIMELVDKDLDRLWGGDIFFDTPEVKGELRLVLEAAIIAGLDYKQGMHELLSLFYLICFKDAEAASTVSLTKRHCESLRLVCHQRFVKHDAFAMLMKLMEKESMDMTQWYETDETPQRRRGPDEPDEMFGVVKIGYMIQTEMLRKVNPDLSHHLTKVLEVQPVLYCLKWLRLLFLREFTFSQSAMVWDAIFADFAVTRCKMDSSLALYVALAMLLYLADDLLGRDDNSTALRRLMRYPPLESTSAIVAQAVRLKHAAGSPMRQLAAVTDSDQQAPGQVTDGSFLVVSESGQVSQEVAASSATVGGPLATRMGTRLTSIIDRMQAKWFPSASAGGAAAAAKVEEDYLYAIAELKKVRDILLGSITEDEAS